MDDTKIEGVGVPVTVSGGVESVSATRNSAEDKVEALRHIRAFADLPEDQLKWFTDNVEDRDSLRGTYYSAKAIRLIGW